MDTKEQYQTVKAELNSKVDLLDAELNAFDWRNEAVRKSDAFIIKKKEFNQAFADLQAFNKQYAKVFSRK